MDNVLKHKLDRLLKGTTTPRRDPETAVGEDDNVELLDKAIEDCRDLEEVLGGFIIGPIGNGKTHFLRYIRHHLANEAICFFIPEMTESGSFLEIQNNLYSQMFSKDNGNKRLSDYPLADIERVCSSEVSDDNIIANRFLRADNELKIKVLDYFNSRFLLESDFKELRSLDLKKDLHSQFGFVELVKSNIEIFCALEKKPFVLLLDELDKLYSAKKEINLSAVGFKVLDMYRTLFNTLNSLNLSGLILIGATKEGLKLVSDHNQALATRFSSGPQLELKSPKTLSMITDFLKYRASIRNLTLDHEELEQIKIFLQSKKLDKPATWREFSRETLKSITGESEFDPKLSNSEELILYILSHYPEGLTANEILERHEEAKARFKSIPTKILSKMLKENTIQREKAGNVYLYRKKT